MTDRDLNRRQCYSYIESHHEEKNQLQRQRHKCEFSKDILDILDIRYEDLRRKVMEAEENKLLSPSLFPFPFSQELLIFIQQGMIVWLEEWTKCHHINPIEPIEPIEPIDMTDSHKIKESDFIGIANNADGNNRMDGIRDTASTTTTSSFHLSISMDLEAQVKNLLTQMAISTILLSASANL